MKDLDSYGTWEQNEAGNGNYTLIPTQWPSGLTRKLRYGVPKILGIRQKHYTCAFLDPISAFRQKCHDQNEGLAVYFPYPASFQCQVWYKADFIMILWPRKIKNWNRKSLIEIGKKMSVSLEFWTPGERIAWVLGRPKRQSAVNSVWEVYVGEVETPIGRRYSNQKK